MTETATAPIRTFRDAEAVLAQALPGYSERPQQQALAAFIEEIIETGGHGLAEAGCGTGKSLGYLIPAILSGKKAVVSTATIALMEQIANKDVPFLQENLGVPFTFALLKGRSNYICRAKMADPKTDPYRVPLRALQAELDADPLHDGDREHFETPVTKEQFSQVAMSSAECPGKAKCPFGQVCFAEAAKERARQADVVVTNTAMLMTDLKVKEMTEGWVNMLGDYDVVIVDEAHETEEIATGALEENINPVGLEKALAEVVGFASQQNATLRGDADAIRAQQRVWALLTEEYDSRKDEKASVSLAWFMDDERVEAFAHLIEALRALAEEVASVRVIRGDEKSTKAAQARLVRRFQNYANNLAEAMTSDDELLVRWIEKDSGRRDGKVVYKLHTAPVHVGSYLYEWLWSQTSALLVSATLSVNGDFGYISDRLGLPENTQSLNVGTPFDYSKQAMLFYPPSQAPNPSRERAAWLSYAGQTIRDLVSASGGGALLLFTSRSAMTQAVEVLKDWLEDEDINYFVQGVGGTNKEIAKAFSEDTHSVLFALKSFFTGVDFQGDACRLVVMDKLAFAVPTDPVFQARAEQVRRHGGNDFTEMTIPNMMLTLLQGYGRLIRTVQDYGVVAILDSRLHSGWGGKIVRGLPDAPKTHSLAEVRDFYQARRGADAE